MAHALGLPRRSQVRIIYRAIGGAFGGKEDMSLQIVLALAVQKLADGSGSTRPVRCRWSREESIVGHHKRHRGRITARWGATCRRVGWWPSRPPATSTPGPTTTPPTRCWETCTSRVCGPYSIPNATVDSWAVYTNAVPGGSLPRVRGTPGLFRRREPDEQAGRGPVRIDPVEIRRRNLLTEGDDGITGTPMPPGVSIDTVVEACAEAAAWAGRNR